MKYFRFIVIAVVFSLPGHGLSQTASDISVTEDEFLADAPPYLSYYGDIKCTNILASSSGFGSMNIALPNYACDSIQLPGTWQNPGAGSEEFDVVIVGGGASGVYMAHRLLDVFKKNNQTVPKIALLERTQWIGGRLMSAQGAGGLGLAVNGNKASEDFPPQEYGGMRIDPYRYRLVFEKIIETGRALFGDDKCLRGEECTQESENCCEAMLTRMEVGDIRYSTTRTDLGILSNSSVFTPSQVYSVGNDGFKNRANIDDLEESVASGKGSPYDNCVQIVLLAELYTQATKNTPFLWKDLVVELCDNCDRAIPGTCDICNKFPGKSKVNGPISCLGYDPPTDTVPAHAIFNLFKEVTNADLRTHLYLVKEGLQRFLQGLLLVDDTIAVAPIFNKQLTSISLESGENPQELSQKQVKSINYDEPMPRMLPSPSTLSLAFADGSIIRAKAAVLTMLPFDMPQIDGLQPWNETISEVLEPKQAIKLVLGWENSEDAPEAKLGMSSCASSTCQRLILDGNSTDDWMVRQVWLWDPKTVMIYNTAPGNITDTNKYPTSNMYQYARKYGQGAMIRKVMDQINEATGLNISMPDWARTKYWPRGNICLNRRQVLFENAATYLERPLGGKVPVFYANSEASPRGEMHGWIQGGWEMVEDNLPDLALYLGLSKNLTKYDPEPYDPPLRFAVGEQPGNATQSSGATTTHSSIAILLTMICCVIVGILQF